MRRAGETANGRTGEARIRAAGSMNLRRFLRQGERIGLMEVAASPPRPFAHSPIRPFAVSPPGSWILAPDSSFCVFAFFPPSSYSQRSDKKGLVHLYGKLLSEPLCRGPFQFPRHTTENSVASVFTRAGDPLGGWNPISFYGCGTISSTNPGFLHRSGSDPTH